MRYPRMLSVVLAIIVVAMVCMGLSAPSMRASTPDSAIQFMTLFSDAYEGTTPGNNLRLDTWPVTTSDPSDRLLFLRVTGTYQGARVRLQGVMVLETQGNGLYVGYVPHFDSMVSAFSPDATRFTDAEASAACGFNLKPRGDGFAGTTTGSTCVIALRGVTGTWSIAIESGSIRVRNVTTSETLRFKRVKK